MSRYVFHNGSAVLSDRVISDAMVCVEDGVITAVGTSAVLNVQGIMIDVKGGYICPGFIDIHVHGGGGADFMDGTADAVRTVCRAHAGHGTTTLFPTTTTGTFEQIMTMISACREVQNTPDARESAIAGIHLYGPYFAADKTGCHSSADSRPPEADEFQRYFDTGLIRIATCAAELTGAKLFYETARRQHCLITCGHSNSSWSEMQVAFDAGMRHVDHFWCAMSSVPSLRQRLGVPMQASMAEFVLAHSEMSTEVIADGMHLSPELLQFAAMMKGASRLCLVTDCNRALDMPPGEYRFGHHQHGTVFINDGSVGWASDESLASSVRGMDHMVRHMLSATDLPLQDVIRMATLTPAERTGISDRTGSLQVGKQADIIVLDSQLRVQKTMIAGKLPVSS